MTLFEMTRASHYASAPSPFVSLERGNYRMRAPISRPTPLVLPGNADPARGRPTTHRVNRNLALLLMLLAVACMTCFASAYYLFTTRWGFRPISRPFTPAHSISQVTVSETSNELEKYLAYLPHSGFHNQRIAFENALLLSRLLRRTLLVPPIRLGDRPIRYVEYDTLARYHELSGKEGLSHCPQIPVYISRPPECLQYFESSYVPWSWLVNLSAIAAHQPLFHRPNMSQIWMRTNYNLKSSDVYTLRDDSAYRFRFLDTLDNVSPPGARYLEDVYIADLATVDERLLQIGTLFGTSRLRLKNPDNIACRQAIRQSMVFTNQELTSAADRIARSLRNNYLGLHLRSGDGQFKQKIQNTIKSTWWKVLHEVLGFSIPEICELEKKVAAEPSFPCVQQNFGLDQLFTHSIVETPMVGLLPTAYRGKCRTPRRVEEHYQLLNIPLFIATDLKDAETHPFMSIFRRTFPCIFFLEDFMKETEPLEQLTSPNDDVNLSPFILPFVDALVVGKAVRFVGTDGSTFSKFVEDILWPSFYSPLS